MIATPFDVLLVIAMAIPVGMIAHYRVIPVLRGRDPVPWPYVLPFASMTLVLFGVALAVYYDPFAFVGTPAEQALWITVGVEFGTVIVVTELLSEAERADDDAAPLP